MSENLSGPTFRALAQIADLGKLGELTRAMQAIIEGKPLGESSLDEKIVVTFEGYSFTERNFRETIIIEDRHYKRHRNGGGWVPIEQSKTDETMPFVAETAFVGPEAWVFGAARVLDGAQIYGRARVSGHARVFGNGSVSESARVNEEARVHGNAHVLGNALVSGTARVGADAMVYGSAHIHGDACVYGSVRVGDDARITKGVLS